MPLSKVNRPGLNTGIADSSDATAITIDSGERVGINGIPVNTGASLPIVDLHGGYSDNGILIRTGDSNTSTGGGTVLQVGFNTGAGYRHNIRTRHDSGNNINNAIEFYTWQTGQNSGDLGNLKVLSAGALGVTMPNQPSFCAYQTASHTTTNGQIYNFTALQTNVGNSFSLSDDRFTAPIGGTYYFSFYQLTGNDASSGDIRFLKNGVAIEAAYGYGVAGHTGHKQATLNIVITLAANDYCQIMSIGTNVWNDRHGNFSGFLIG